MLSKNNMAEVMGFYANLEKEISDGELWMLLNDKYQNVTFRWYPETLRRAMIEWTCSIEFLVMANAINVNAVATGMKMKWQDLLKGGNNE